MDTVLSVNNDRVLPCSLPPPMPVHAGILWTPLQFSITEKCSFCRARHICNRSRAHRTSQPNLKYREDMALRLEEGKKRTFLKCKELPYFEKANVKEKKNFGV